MVSNSNRFSVSRAVVLVLCLAHFCNAFHSTSFVRPVVRQTNNVSSKRTANVKGLCMISARKQKFWNQVNGAWAEKFSATEISRILKFEKYNKQELPAPEPAGPLHQPCEEYVEGLEARPWWEPAEFAWGRALEAESDVIQEEFQQYLRAVGEFRGDSAVMAAMGAGWSSVRLQRLGRWNLENCARFPKTVALLEALEIPLAVRGVMFARQRPGTGVAPHSDGRNFILTAHLGIDIPKDNCWIEVGGERRTWQNNKALILDTSFEHSTFNGEDNPDRIVLLIDFWHPGLSPQEREALEMVYEIRNEYDSGGYIEGYVKRGEKEKLTGALNPFKKLFFNK
mmetsp:Transcript_24471/g.42740  ORF Transcript_24471/g.42740 Transcript_24471/m.42740 type:complete len:339 (+) Transcript_24471:3-1019(+)